MSNNNQGEDMSKEADKAAQHLREWMNEGRPAIGPNNIRVVLDDRDRLIGELREAQAKLAEHQRPVRWVVTQQELDDEAKVGNDIQAKLDELERRTIMLVRQQVDDSADCRARLLRLERLHGLAVEST